MKKYKWDKLLARDNADFITASAVDRHFFKLVKEFSPQTQTPLFTYMHKKHLIHYARENFWETCQKSYQKYFSSPQLIKKYYQEGKNFSKEIIKTNKLRQKKLNSRSSSDNFLKAWQDFDKQYKRINHIYSITSWLAIETWQHDFNDLLDKMIKRNQLSEQVDSIVSSTCVPWKKTAIYQIQDKLNKGVKTKQLVKDYQYLRSWTVVWYQPINEAWFKDLAVSSKEKISVKKYSKDKLYKLLKPNNKEKKYLELAPYMFFFKDWRDDFRRAFNYHWSWFFDLLAKKYGVPRDDIGYLTTDEITQVFKTDKLPKDIIKHRKLNPVIITANSKNEKLKIIDKKIPKKYFDIMNDVASRGQGGAIKGLIAQRGVVKGRVKIIYTPHDIKNFKTGDILVANTTHPNYLPAMKRAKAFVTDEGGIVSHAAIVARELKIACIVGTKTATKILKDGDMVDVDADNGIVKKI
jgi:phosphohistidine swiveling domain-containing protein